MTQTWRKRLTAFALITSLVISLPLYADENDDSAQDTPHEAKTSSLTVTVPEGEVATTTVAPEVNEVPAETKTVTTDNQEKQDKAPETTAPTTEQKKSAPVTGSSLTPVEVVNTEETGILSGNKTTTNSYESITKAEELERKKKEKERKEKERKEKEKKAKEELEKKKDAKDPYKGEELKEEKPRHYNTVYKGSAVFWESDTVSPKRKELREVAETMLGWDYSQPKRMNEGYADCSSFVHRTLMLAGYLPKESWAFTTYTMPNYTKYLEEIDWADIKVGDIILGDGHVAFYWGEDDQGHPITLESCGAFGVGYGYMMYGGWDFNYTSVWRVKGIDEGMPEVQKEVVNITLAKKGIVSVWDLLLEKEALDDQAQEIAKKAQEAQEKASAEVQNEQQTQEVQQVQQ